MLLGNSKNLENQILLTLTAEKVSTVHEIIKNLATQGVKTSVQGAYRVLRKLQKEGVIVKNKDQYSIRIPWILDLDLLTRALEDKYLNEKYFNQLIPLSVGQKYSWTFNNLYKLNDFWSQLILLPIKNSKTKILLNYTPHAWFHVIQTHQEAQYIKTSNDLLRKTYTFIAGQTYLDKWATKFWSPDKVEYFLAPKDSWHIPDRTTHVNVIDDFVFTVKIDPLTTKAIDDLYDKVTNESELRIADVMEIFGRTAKCKISVRKNPVLARQYRKRFEKTFGPIF